MSSVLIFQKNDNIYIGSDTAISTKIHNKTYRISDNGKKLYIVNDMVIFCSGDLDLSYKIMDIFSTCKSKTIIALKKICKQLHDGDKVVEIMASKVFKGYSIVYQISSYNNFEIKEHVNANSDDVYVWAGGFKTEQVCNKAYELMMAGYDLECIYEKVYNTISCEEIGGFLDIYKLNNKNILHLYHKKIEEDYINVLTIDGLDNLSLVVAEHIYGKLGAFAQVQANNIVVGNDGGKLSDDVIANAEQWNGKKTIFTAQPTPPYQQGDLWRIKNDNDFKICVTAKVNGQTYSSADWEYATNIKGYVDSGIKGANDYTDNKIGQIDLSKYAPKSFMNGLMEISPTEGFVAYKNSAKQEFVQIHPDGIYRVILNTSGNVVSKKSYNYLNHAGQHTTTHQYYNMYEKTSIGRWSGKSFIVDEWGDKWTCNIGSDKNPPSDDYIYSVVPSTTISLPSQFKDVSDYEITLVPVTPFIPDFFNFDKPSSEGGGIYRIKPTTIRDDNMENSMKIVLKVVSKRKDSFDVVAYYRTRVRERENVGTTMQIDSDTVYVGGITFTYILNA